MFVRAYLQASSAEHGYLRARGALDRFAADRGLRIAARYIEYDTETALERPELFRLLSDCESGDVLLIEEIGRLSRLRPQDWKKLRSQVYNKEVRIVARDLPTSWTLATPADYFSNPMFKVVNNLMLDVLAAVARNDASDTRNGSQSRLSNLVHSARTRGRPENKARNNRIAQMLTEGRTWREIIIQTGCSRTHIAKITRRIKQNPEQRSL
ncbi:recombinase family protein [Sphingomonas prati]|uniref:DNA invertase Pin-like site-specific DNA recombinase n=1 Tax=Sphingomonas prati TaxID=1843237 RepID=A0A7W9BVJ1_9SPHN|nr:recombinase family protein [Sphingomonas prati]MBB5730918.1 DNA invertase Pin-like site-specific DNA recombinase [Sphingomonas prati]